MEQSKKKKLPDSQNAHIVYKILKIIHSWNLKNISSEPGLNMLIISSPEKLSFSSYDTIVGKERYVYALALQPYTLDHLWNEKKRTFQSLQMLTL